MKIIFLDMDGVLCTWRSHIAGKGYGLMEDLDREAVGMLNRLAAAGAVVYVLSSTWRNHFDRAEMEQRLRAAGWTGAFHDDWKTVRLPHRMSEPRADRGEEIQEWLDRHKEIAGFLILDDDSDMLPAQLPWFVQTDAYDGISHKNFERANEVLHGDRAAWFKHLRARMDEGEAKRETARLALVHDDEDGTEN